MYLIRDHLCERIYQLNFDYLLMEIHYSISKRRSPLSPTTPAKWYATLQYRGTWTIDDMAEHIASYHGRLYDEDDIKHIANLFCKYAKELLMEGYRLRFDDLGTLFLTCHAEGSFTKEGFTDKNILSLRVRLMPSTGFKGMLHRLNSLKE